MNHIRGGHGNYIIILHQTNVFIVEDNMDIYENEKIYDTGRTYISQIISRKKS